MSVARRTPTSLLCARSRSYLVLLDPSSLTEYKEHLYCVLLCVPDSLNFNSNNISVFPPHTRAYCTDSFSTSKVRLLLGLYWKLVHSLSTVIGHCAVFTILTTQFWIQANDCHRTSQPSKVRVTGPLALCKDHLFVKKNPCKFANSNREEGRNLSGC